MIESIAPRDGSACYKTTKACSEFTADRSLPDPAWDRPTPRAGYTTANCTAPATPPQDRAASSKPPRGAPHRRKTVLRQVSRRAVHHTAARPCCVKQAAARCTTPPQDRAASSKPPRGAPHRRKTVLRQASRRAVHHTAARPCCVKQAAARCTTPPQDRAASSKPPRGAPHRRVEEATRHEPAPHQLTWIHRSGERTGVGASTRKASRRGSMSMIWSDMFATRGGTSCEQHTRWDRRAGNGARSRFATNIKQLTTPHVANRLKFVLSVVASMLADHPHRPAHRWIQD